MKRFAAALCAAALAACGEGAVVDPVAEARAACADATLSPAAQAAGCTALIAAGPPDEAAHAGALAQRGDAAARGGDVTAALRDYAAALELHPDEPRALLGRTRILFESGQIDAAEVLITRLLATRAYPADANFLAGAIAYLRGDRAGAETLLTRAIEANPDLAAAYVTRARIKEDRRDYAGALADYDEAVNRAPHFAAALSGRCWARVLSEADDLAPARADAQAAIAADARDMRGLLCEGLLALREGRWAAARTAYEAALEIEPGNPAALFGRGVARRRAGDNQGRADMNQARDFDRHIARTFEELGVRSF